MQQKEKEQQKETDKYTTPTLIEKTVQHEWEAAILGAEDK